MVTHRILLDEDEHVHLCIGPGEWAWPGEEEPLISSGPGIGVWEGGNSLRIAFRSRADAEHLQALLRQLIALHREGYRKQPEMELQ